MKPIIIRKPKFMRKSDYVMKTYLNVAAIIMDEACEPDVTSEQKVKLLIKAGDCLNKAAKAGGFLNVTDMHKWIETHQT